MIDAITIWLFGVYPVTVVIALFILERNNPGYENEAFFGALFWPVVILFVTALLIRDKYTEKDEVDEPPKEQAETYWENL